MIKDSSGGSMQQQTTEQIRKKQQARRVVSLLEFPGTCLVVLLSFSLLAVCLILGPSIPHVSIWLFACSWLLLGFIGWPLIVTRYMGWVTLRKRAWLKQYGLLVTAQIDTCTPYSTGEGGTSYSCQVHVLPSPGQPAEYRFSVSEGPYAVGQLIQVWIDPEDLAFHVLEGPIPEREADVPWTP